MRLGSQIQNRLTLLFEYVRLSDEGEQTVARGEQGVACMRSEQGRLSPTHIPESFRRALEAYAE
jgi:enediyne biosynthesis thioesterase